MPFFLKTVMVDWEGHTRVNAPVLQWQCSCHAFQDIYVHRSALDEGITELQSGDKVLFLRPECRGRVFSQRTPHASLDP